VRLVISSILNDLNIEDGELSVLFVDDKEITQINMQYLDRNRPTNVIAFPMREGEFGDLNPHLLGDIVVSVETAQRDAEQEALPFEDEMDYLIIHGILHLLGYDHEISDAELQKMRNKEKELFRMIKNYDID
jgi:probable rRNA maturation factor